MTDHVSRLRAAATLVSDLDAHYPKTLTDFALRLLSSHVCDQLVYYSGDPDDPDAMFEEAEVWMYSAVQRDTQAKRAAIATFDRWLKEQSRWWQEQLEAAAREWGNR